jgi:hypothetical protein
LNLDILRRVHTYAKAHNGTINKVIRWSDGQTQSFKGSRAMFGTSQILKQFVSELEHDIIIETNFFCPMYRHTI